MCSSLRVNLLAMALACFQGCFGICIIIAVVAFAQEPSCNTINRFEYEYKVLQKLDSLEKGGVTLSKKHAALLEQFAALVLENKGIYIMRITFNTIEIEKMGKCTVFYTKVQHINCISSNV